MAISYKLFSDGVIRHDDILLLTTTIPSTHRLYQEYLEWVAEGNTADPEFTTAEQAQMDYDDRQNVRVENLKGALVMQFKMILALFQVGRDKGVWVVGDFDSDLVTQAQAWIQLIDDYENDAP